jgi:hypothetical protein
MLAWDGDHADLGYPVPNQRADGKLVTIYYIVYGERDSEGIKGIAPKNAFTRSGGVSATPTSGQPKIPE